MNDGLGAIVAFLCVVCGCFGLLIGREIAPQPDPFEGAKLRTAHLQTQVCYTEVAASHAALRTALEVDRALLRRYGRRP